MRQHNIVANVVEPVVDDHPIAGGLDDGMGIVPVAIQKRCQRMPVVPHPPRAQRLAGAVLNNMAVGFVVVDANVIIVKHGRTSSVIEIVETPIRYAARHEVRLSLKRCQHPSDPRSSSERGLFHATS
jgi:hypothetical protein